MKQGKFKGCIIDKPTNKVGNICGVIWIFSEMQNLYFTLQFFTGNYTSNI